MDRRTTENPITEVTEAAEGTVAPAVADAGLPPGSVPVAPPTRAAGRLSYREAIDNPCASCTTSPCCRYLPLATFPVATLADVDYAAYLLNFDNIELGIAADGTWSAYYRQACRFLDADGGGCTLHGTPEKPHICQQYNPYSCWYRPALAGPGHEDYLRVDRARLERLVELVEFDEGRRIAEAPSWPVLQELFADLPVADVTDTAPAAAPDAAFDEWQLIALGTKPPVGRTWSAADPELTRGDPCTGCSAHCCTTLMFAIGAPTTASNLDYLRFALGFPGTEIVVGADSWSLAVNTSCRHLDGDRCGVFGQPERPIRCQYLDAWSCSYKAVFGSPRPEHAVRVRLEELPAMTSAFAFDELGVAAEIPSMEAVRAAVESAWTATALV